MRGSLAVAVPLSTPLLHSLEKMTHYCCQAATTLHYLTVMMIGVSDPHGDCLLQIKILATLVLS